MTDFKISDKHSFLQPINKLFARKLMFKFMYCKLVNEEFVQSNECIVYKYSFINQKGRI